jgi:hypothetical protein
LIGGKHPIIYPLVNTNIAIENGGVLYVYQRVEAFNHAFGGLWDFDRMNFDPNLVYVSML